MVVVARKITCATVRFKSCIEKRIVSYSGNNLRRIIVKQNMPPTGTIWITGLSASGKTTLGKKLTDDLIQAGFHNVEHLDGEVLRTKYDRIYGYSVEERFAVLENIIRIAKECNKKGKIAVVSTISHKRQMRRIACKALVPFMEVYLKCSVETCASRDYKGNYKKAFAGELDTFIGVTEPYELSDNPELVVNTAHQSIDKCSSILLEKSIDFLNMKAVKIACD